MKFYALIASLCFIGAFALVTDFGLDVWTQINRVNYVKKEFSVDSVRWAQEKLIGTGLVEGKRCEIGLRSNIKKYRIRNQTDAEKYFPSGKVISICFMKSNPPSRFLVQGRTLGALEEEYVENGDLLARVLFPVFLAVGLVGTFKYWSLRPAAPRKKRNNQ